MTNSVVCPFCGHVNSGLLLEETLGWMECSVCSKLSKAERMYSREKKSSPMGILLGKAEKETPAFAY